MRLQSPDTSNLLKSAGIVCVTAGLLLLFKWGFPAFNWAPTEALILGTVSTWFVNVIKESIEW